MKFTSFSYGQRQSCWRLLLKMTDRENLFATNLEKYHNWRYVNLFIVGPEPTEIMSFFKFKNLGNFRFAELMKLLSEYSQEKSSSLKSQIKLFFKNTCFHRTEFCKQIPVSVL